ncbi:ATP-binding protein [Mycobacterium avium subsp. hominissuis]
MPPHLAGREREHAEFDQLLRQDPVLKNLILTGLRGVGKTVLLETFKPRAVAAGWHWVGTDLSQSASVSEESLATRILTDLAVVTSSMTVKTPPPPWSRPVEWCKSGRVSACGSVVATMP